MRAASTKRRSAPSSTSWSTAKSSSTPTTTIVLGYQGIYVGQGRVARTGDPATLRLLESEREAVVGDYLMEEEDVEPPRFRAAFAGTESRRPHHLGPRRRVADRSIPRRRDQPRLCARARAWPRAARLPNRQSRSRRSALTRRFRRESAIAGRACGHDDGVPHLDRISYALVMEATTPITLLDAVRNP